MELKFSEGDKSVYTMLHSVLAQPFPDPGQTIEAHTFRTVMKEDGQVDYIPEQFRLTRSNDDYEYLEYVSYDTLFHCLTIEQIMLIFECLLNERRILLSANNLSTLTSCMDAISNMPYPFAWQYVFIPILPKSMVSFLGAPMPFLMGILSTSLEDALKEPMEEGVLIVDLDNGEILQAPEDLPPIMPPAATEKLRKSFKKIVASPKRHMELSIDVAHSLIKFWCSLFGNYGKYMDPVYDTPQGTSSNASQLALIPSSSATGIEKQPSASHGTVQPSTPPSSYRFNFDRFVKSKAADIKKFLVAFKEYQLYDCFIGEREDWMKKGIIDYCIILRAQNAKKKDSIVAVKAKFRSHVDKMLAAWNAEPASAPKKSRATTISSSQEGIDSRKDSTDRESTDSDARHPSPDSRSLSATADSDSEDASTQSQGKSDKASKAAPGVPSVPPKPSKKDRKTGAMPPATVAPSGAKVAPTTTPKHSKSNGTATVSAPVATTTAPSIPFGSRFTFKPTPLTDGIFEKQIWKLCNVEALADAQVSSNEGHKYWVYTPVLFQRLPSLADVKKVDGAIPVPLSDDAIELLLQWVFSDELLIDTADSVLELLAAFPPVSSKKGSVNQLRQLTAITAIQKIAPENALPYVKVFAKGNLDDPLIAAVLTASKLAISKFSPEEMTPLARRQLGAVSHVTLASILHLHSSFSARQEAQDAVNDVVNGSSSSFSTSSSSSSSSKPKGLVTDLTSLMESGNYSDMTLIFPSKVGDKSTADKDIEIKVHSKILTARSPHLSRILTHNAMSPVTILNVPAAQFRILMPFIYTGKLGKDVKDDRESVFELVQAAHVLDLDTLSFREALHVALSALFTTSSVFEFLTAPATSDGSLQHPAERAVLVGAAAHYLANHPTIFYRPEKLKSLEPDVWECIFKYAYAPTVPTTISSPHVRTAAEENFPPKSPRPTEPSSAQSSPNDKVAPIAVAPKKKK